MTVLSKLPPTNIKLTLSHLLQNIDDKHKSDLINHYIKRLFYNS